MDVLLTDAVLATMEGPGFGLIPKGAVLLRGGRVVWAGPEAEAPDAPRESMGGRLVTPGLVDCHTHAVFAGNRAGEFAQRLRGESYAAIAEAGGGILSTVRATRGATVAELAALARPWLAAMAARGVTTVEIKSGYGLDVETELRMLRAARALSGPVRVVTSWLAAHAVPPEFAGRRGAYLEEVCIAGLRAAHAEGLVDAVDGFCEGIAFAPDEMARVFAVARELGLPVKLHAEQLSDLGGAAMAAGMGALSCDHLEYLGADGVAAMAAAGTVAVLLPGAFYTLRERQAPPVQALRDAGVPMAVATDFNPGSSPLSSLPMAMNMACVLFGLTPEEAVQGATVTAARALGLSDCGRIAPGCRADLAVWEAGHPDELVYWTGGPALWRRYLEGVAC